MKDAERESAEAFLARHARYVDPYLSASQCRNACQDLQAEVPELEGEMIWVREHRVEVAPVNPRATQAPAHAMLRLPSGKFVDVTRRPRGLGWRLSRSQLERTRREDRHSKFYEISDNLATATRGLTLRRTLVRTPA